MRHVLRPHFGRQAADVRDGLSEPGAGLRDAGDDRGNASREAFNTFQFGNQQITTKVFMMAPEGTGEVSIDVADYMWEGQDEMVAQAF